MADAQPKGSASSSGTAKDAKDAKAADAKSGENSKPAITNPFHKEALKALGGGIPDAILDIRISSTEQQDSDLSRNGYEQILQEGVRKNNNTTISTFGNKTSLWVWRRSQGTCSGRLKPIIDVIFDASSVSSDLVLTGYTCDPITIAGYSLWIKRASTEEEEKDAVTDLYVTTGKMRDTSDPIWTAPGVGWVRVDGNFTRGFFSSIDSFLWYRPARQRSMEAQLSNPIKAAVALTDEIRQTKLLAAIRIALRHYVPVNDVKRLATLVMDSSQLSLSATNAAMIKSDRMLDFCSLYHQYSSKGKMSYNNWLNLLYDVGCRMKSTDVVQMFRFFDNNQNGYVSIEEYTQILVLTDYELDLAMEKIRIKLLLPCIPRDIMKASSGNKPQSLTQKANIGVIGAHSIQLHPYIGKNKIRENITLGYIFSILNVKKDSILSLDDLMDLSSKLEVFLTEEEARKALSLMDINGDDRVEEADFIAFMRRDSMANMKKAYRLREGVAMLRRWLVRGTTSKLDQSSLTATASKEQWKGFKSVYKKVFTAKFPGYLSPQLLQIALRNLGIFLSTIEARELTLMVAPEKSGRVHLADLHTFMGRNCRSYGELIALFEREILMDLVEAYRAQYKARHITGKEDLDLTANYTKKLEELKRNIENIYLNVNNKPTTTSGKGTLPAAPTIPNKDMDDYDEDDYAAGRSFAQSNVALSPTEASQQQRLMRMKSHDIISVAQLRVGLWDYYAKKATNNASTPETASPKIPEAMFPNAEELAALSILFDTDIAEGDIYGVRLRGFLDCLCHHIVVGNNREAFEKSIPDGSKVDIISRELQLQLFREAKAISSQNKSITTKQQQVPDYLSVFQLFDENKNGLISLAEFRSLLKRYQLVNNLPDHLLADLLNKFDKTKKGNINFADFRSFAEEVKTFVNDEDARFIAAAIAASAPPATNSAAASAPSSALSVSATTTNTADTIDVEKLSDEDLVDPDDYTAVSDTPPITITNNKDCDWLLWFLYRQACKLDPKEPESIIADLESLCYEFYMNNRKIRGSSKSSKNGVPIISVKDMWNLLFEVHIQGNLVKAQFYTGVEFISHDLNVASVAITADERVIDYNALCKYVVRMGRGYLSYVQDRQIALQKKYQTIFPDLKTYFKQLCDEVPADKKDEVPRFIKIFRRLDRDHDGMITVLEFKLGLKRLMYKDFKIWTITMIKFLFRACDKNDDGLLSITEFMEFILDRHPATLTTTQQQMVIATNTQLSTMSTKLTIKNPDTLNESDDDEKNDFFNRKASSTDFQLMQKVNEILMDVVPSEAASNMSQAKHIETVRASVLRFFQRADVENKGLVTEDRFKEFLRRSGLKDKLNSSEIRRLTDKLRKRGKGNENFIEYEKLSQQILSSAESVPRSKAEMIYTRFQDAAIASASSGRSFFNLCTLVDLHNTGRISKEELLHISKMMDCPMTLAEWDMMSELFDEDTRIVDKRSQTIDYLALQNFLQAYSVRNNMLTVNRSLDSQPLHGHLSAFATPGHLAHLSQSHHWDVSGHGLNKSSINTPLGYAISTPQKFSAGSGVNNSFALSNTPVPLLFPPGHTPLSMSMNGGGGVSEKILRTLIERIRIAVDQRSSSWGVAISLRKRFESQDLQNAGFVSTRILQMILEELTIVMTTSELYVLYQSYGKADDDRFFYDSFCRAVETIPTLEKSVYQSQLPPSGFQQQGNVSNSMSMSMSMSAAYLSSRVLQRYKELKQEGRYPLELFQVYDLERNGMVLANKFKDVITRSQLLTTEHQLMKAMEDFSAIGNKSYINYEDFCESIEKAIRNSGDGNSNNPINATANLRASLRRGSGTVDGNGYDGMRVSNELRDLPSGRDDPNELYESLHRVRMSSGSDNNNYHYNNNHNAFGGQNSSRSSREDFYDYALSPPKPSDSISMFPSANHQQRRSIPGSPGKRPSSPPIQAPRTSPSKIGTKMWGHETPIPQKGRSVRVDDEKWCCKVCLYVENPNSAMNCLVCDSPNYDARKDYQVKEQCRNCTFLNGHFAEECEMCGEPLSHAKVKKDIESPFPSGRRYTISSGRY